MSYNQFGGAGIPLDSLNEKPEKDRTKDKKKNRKKKRRKGKKDRVWPRPVVSPGKKGFFKTLKALNDMHAYLFLGKIFVVKSCTY